MILAQLSDLHLQGMVGKDESYHRFLACLDLALAQNPPFLLLTGDLVNNGQKAGYDWLFSVLNKTALPYACLAGNHDVTLEIGHELPYEQRQFFPIKKDPRLINFQAFNLKNHQLICLNSTVAGAEFGQLSTTQLTQLQTTLANNSKPAIIALHHHPIAVGSSWIDQLMLKNSNDLFKIITPFTHLQAMVCGHVHQAHHLHHQHLSLFTAPAVSRQFLPFCDKFATANQPAGIQVLITENNTILAECFRLNS